ncbi:MAG: HAD family hydrolase [Candidatus Aminicenantes bacterium]|nr:MAG: HAD family hydrolase [Candidatus Aminicenantes bacterium]
MKKRAVFLDRDGTINRDVGYPNSYNMVEIFPYSFAAVRKINRAGFLSVIVTNQSGVGKGFIEEKNLRDIHRNLRLDFAKQKATIDAIYYCPHYEYAEIPEYRKACACRKPNPGMAQQAVCDFNIDTAKSYMIGDKAEDILFGMNIQATSILLLTGFGQKSISKLKEKGVEPAYVAETLKEAVDWILRREKENP